MVVAATVIRLGRQTRRGLLSLCFFLAFWVAGLILLESPETAEIAERVVPAGVLLAAAFVHAGADVTHLERRSVVFFAYAGAGVVALLGVIDPRLLYARGARAPGPLFIPIAIPTGLASAALTAWLSREAVAARGLERRRRAALAMGCFVGSLGGGGVIGLRVYGI